MMLGAWGSWKGRMETSKKVGSTKEEPGITEEKLKAVVLKITPRVSIIKVF